MSKSQVLACIAVLACGMTASIQAASVRQSGLNEPGIYSAVLADLFRGQVPSALVVQRMALPLPAPTAADWAWFGPGTNELRAIVATTTVPRVSPFSVELFSPAATLVDKDEILELFRTAPAGRGPDDRWIPFRTRFKVQTYQGFSRPVVSRDALNAFLYYSHSCGQTCGEAGYAWLQRSEASADWVVVKRLPKVTA